MGERERLPSAGSLHDACNSGGGAGSREVTAVSHVGVRALINFSCHNCCSRKLETGAELGSNPGPWHGPGLPEPDLNPAPRAHAPGHGLLHFRLTTAWEVQD